MGKMQVKGGWSPEEWQRDSAYCYRLITNGEVIEPEAMWPYVECLMEQQISDDEKARILQCVCRSCVQTQNCICDGDANWAAYWDMVTLLVELTVSEVCGVSIPYSLMKECITFSTNSNAMFVISHPSFSDFFANVDCDESKLDAIVSLAEKRYSYLTNQ